MLRLLRRQPRQAPEASGGSSSPADNSAAAAAAAATAPREARATTRQRQRVQWLLLLHAAWLATVALLAAASIEGRRRRGLLLAQQLTGGSSAATRPSALPPPSFSAVRCGEALQLPQVALLFLVKGDMHHEQMWRLWFQSAAAQVPIDNLAAALCGSGSSCGGSSGSSPPGGGLHTQLLDQAKVLQACSSTGSVGSSGGDAAVPGTDAAIDAARNAARDATKASAAAAAADIASGTFKGSSSGSWCVLDRQLLFDVYVHPHPDFPGYPPGSVFYGRELGSSERVSTRWGEHSLVDAARALLRAAMRNPRNAKFVLLSESDLPLYPPHLLYSQLLGERRSRLNACNTTRGWGLFPGRWVADMETQRVKRHHWRKSWQWFALSRRHVRLVLADWEVDGVFRAHCNTTWDEERGKEQECYSDEHYFGTLLAVLGLDHETDCQGWLTDSDWKRVPKGTAHPWHYLPEELGGSLVHRLRRPELPGCSHAAAAAAAAWDSFVPAADLDSAAAARAGAADEEEGGAVLAGLCRRLALQQEQQQQRRPPPLGPLCRLLARKFLPHTAEAALAALAPCDSSALVLNNGVCPGETGQQAAWRSWRQRAAPVVLLGSGAGLGAVLAALFLAGLAAGRVGSGGKRRERQ